MFYVGSCGKALFHQRDLVSMSSVREIPFYVRQIKFNVRQLFEFAKWKNSFQLKIRQIVRQVAFTFSTSLSTCSVNTFIALQNFQIHWVT